MVYAQTRIHSRKYNSLGLWDTNESTNPKQKTRPSINQQKEKNLSSRVFCCSSRPQTKNERKRNDRRIAEYCQRAGKMRIMKVRVKLVVVGNLGRSQLSWKRVLRNWRSEDLRPSRPQHCFNQPKSKSPGDLRELTQTSEKKKTSV